MKLKTCWIKLYYINKNGEYRSWRMENTTGLSCKRIFLRHERKEVFSIWLHQVSLQSL